MKFKVTISILLLLVSKSSFALYTTVKNNLSGDDVPGFAVGNIECSGTLISPRVVITAASCLEQDYIGGEYFSEEDGAVIQDDYDDSNRTEFYNRKTGEKVEGSFYDYPGHDNKVVHDISVVILDKPYSSSEVKPIKIPSYVQEKKFLEENANFVMYGVSDHNFDTEATFQDQYIYDTEQNEGARPFHHKSIMEYRKEAPNRLCDDCGADDEQLFTASLYDLLYNELSLTDAEVNDLFLLTAEILNSDTDDDIISPVAEGDEGGTIAYKHSGEIYFLGNIAGTQVHTRAKTYWPWIVKTVQEHSVEDAKLIGQQAAGAKNWNWGRRGQVGDIYVYSNPYNGDVEYFRLAKLGRDLRYWYFPINRSDNFFWEYLGTELPKFNFERLHRWGENDRKGKLGETFIYSNPYNGDVEYFRLARLGGDKRYWYFPINKKDNYFWKYLGTDIPE